MKDKQQNKNRAGLVIFLLWLGTSMILSALSLGFNINIRSLILSLTSFALAFLALHLSKRSDDKMKAMARSAFHEKMAVIYGYMGREKERRESDIKAAEELRGWVGGDLQREYGKLRKEYNKLVEGDIMDTSDEDSSESDIGAIKKDLGEIKESLDRIEKRQSEDSKSTLQQFLISLGFACMAIGIASLAFEYKVAGYCILTIGIVLALGGSGLIGSASREIKRVWRKACRYCGTKSGEGKSNK
jgi:hypothetical protein